MQENHSFDNYFGTYPGRRRHPERTCMPVAALAGRASGRSTSAVARSPTSLTTRRIHRIQYLSGKMDGFVRAASVDRQTAERSVMGYYDDRDLPSTGTSPTSTSSSTASSPPRGRQRGKPPVLGDRDARRPGRAGFDNRPDDLRPARRRGITWKFYVQNYDPRRPRRRCAVPLLNFGSYIEDPKLFAPHRRPGPVLRGPARRTLPAVAYIAPPAPASIRRGGSRPGSARPQADQRPAMQQRLGQLGVHVDLRRLGRVVRPRPAAGSTAARGLPRAGPAGEPLCAPWPRRQHPARLHLDPGASSRTTGGSAPRAARPRAQQHRRCVRLLARPRAPSIVAAARGAVDPPRSSLGDLPGIWRGARPERAPDRLGGPAQERGAGGAACWPRSRRGRLAAARGPVPTTIQTVPPVPGMRFSLNGDGFRGRPCRTSDVSAASRRGGSLRR